jgi:2-methylcitrate dehydratase
MVGMNTTVTLGKDTNQALGIGQFAVDFLAGRLGPGPSARVIRRTCQFHTDSVLCGVSALALNTNAPTILRAEALEYLDERGAHPFGSETRVKTEKAIVANSAAVREWDSNGTNFGYNPDRGFLAGEFGHNDYYPVAVAACQHAGLDGATAVRAMILLDEIRGRLAEVFSLKSYKIDHVVHGAIASAAVYAAHLGGSPEQIESAIGMFVAHYIPWRAIRAGKQLSDSKGASAALSTEAAVLSAKRALRGFVGPRDIFRNPESMFRQFERTAGDSPFDLVLTHSGDDFAVMGMHFKLGLYEHQSAGALQGVIDLMASNPELLIPGRIAHIVIKAYEPAFGIIGDPAKRDPHTRQSADHSMVYIVAAFLGKAVRLAPTNLTKDSLWQQLMLEPSDYSESALFDPVTRELMEKISFEHGGPEYDSRYPNGIPTSVVITDTDGKQFDSGLVMYPAGHARNGEANLDLLLEHKFKLLGNIGLSDEAAARALIERLEALDVADADQVSDLYRFEIAYRDETI